MEDRTDFAHSRRSQLLAMNPGAFAGFNAGELQHPTGSTSTIGTSEPTSPQFVRRVLAARNARRHFFDADLFADPAWDILLELYALQCEQQRTSVSKLCLAAGVPATTALRWIDKLHGMGLLEREADPLDARRSWVALSNGGFETMKSYLLALGRGPGLI